MTKVVHCKKESYDIYIGRPSKFGNPFEIGIDGDREVVIKKFKEWLKSGNNFNCKNATPEKRIMIINSLGDLKNKTLGCWCAPKPCHGDILVELACGINGN